MSTELSVSGGPRSMTSLHSSDPTLLNLPSNLTCTHRTFRLPLTRTAAAAALALTLAAPALRAADTPIPPASSTPVEGAIGLLAIHGPEFMGSQRSGSKLLPGFFLRYGRFSITNASGFVTRRDDDVVRGLGIELSNQPNLRVTLGLRYDTGRSESSSDDLRGLGDVKNTVRARLSAQYALDRHWKLGGAWSVDAFGRGGGNLGELTLRHERNLSPQTHAFAGAALVLAGDRYMQTYFGVTPDQAARSGYRVYTPGAGLRDASLFAGVRHDLARDWVMLGGLSTTRLLGPAADSPLTRRQTSFAINGGIAWRF